MLLIARMALIGTALGLVVGALAPYATQGLFARFDLRLIPALYAEPLLLAAGFGLVTALAFSLPSLFQAMRVKPAQLFRAVATELGEIRRRDMIPVGLAAVALAALAVVSTGNVRLSLGFVAAACMAFALFQLLAAGAAAPGALGPHAVPQSRAALRLGGDRPAARADRQHRALAGPRPHRAGRGDADPGQHHRRDGKQPAGQGAELLLPRHPAGPDRGLRPHAWRLPDRGEGWNGCRCCAAGS